MRLNITDKFLWDVYSFFEELGDTVGPIFRPYPTMGNSLPGIKNPVFKKYRKQRGRKKFAKLIYYLKKRGYIKIENLKKGQAIILTEQGICKALKASFAIEGGKMRRDGKWIMIIFDIPAKNRKARNLLRSVLLNLKYKMLQQSVWITPYDVSEKTEKLLQIYLLDSYVKIFLIEKI
ncbi:MAG: Uncharacterized protein CEN87_662 [Parcubacteria group bacterium Licking1014_1]|nr:MAG: Uncharacterized protein CEN87_662 [Parcubacteria group bacterium Licking1014_1]